MGPDLELKRSEFIMEASGSKDSAGAINRSEDNHLRCTSNYEDNSFEMDTAVDERTERAVRSCDVEVDILDCTNTSDVGAVEAKYQDATESSSSFGGSTSGFDNGTMPVDAEVESELHGDASSALPFDGYSALFRMRKKRLTPHWRAYIRPLMWRCKWLELQIKNFQTQAIKYDRELAEFNQRKQLGLEDCIMEGFGAKSLPFSGKGQRREVMKRNKRKKVEDTVDIASYTSHHNLFSYYENKRSSVDAAFMDDGWGNQEKTITGNDELDVPDEMLSNGFRDCDKSLEQILGKIDVVKSHVSKMKTRLHKVTSENAERLSASDKLSLLAPCHAFTSTAQNPASPHNSGDRVLVGSSYIGTQHIAKDNKGDLVIPGSAASSHGEVTHVPDIVESTDKPEVGAPSKNIVDGILIYNRRAKGRVNNFKKGDNRPTEKSQVPKEEQDSSIPPFDGVQDTDHPTDDQPTPKIRSISKLTATKNKRKRGRRNVVSGRPKGRSSG